MHLEAIKVKPDFFFPAEPLTDTDSLLNHFLKFNHSDWEHGYLWRVIFFGIAFIYSGGINYKGGFRVVFSIQSKVHVVCLSAHSKAVAPGFGTAIKRTFIWSNHRSFIVHKMDCDDLCFPYFVLIILKHRLHWMGFHKTLSSQNYRFIISTHAILVNTTFLYNTRHAWHIVLPIYIACYFWGKGLFKTSHYKTHKSHT